MRLVFSKRGDFLEVCCWCGGSGQVPRAATEKSCDVVRGREKVECPKCRDGYKMAPARRKAERGDYP